MIGSGYLVVDLDLGSQERGEGQGAAAETHLSREDVARLRTLLPTLPCVTIIRGTGLVSASDPEPAWSDLFDVKVEDDATLTAMLDEIAGNPIAAVSFVELLRSKPLTPPSTPMSLEAVFSGLVAESFVYSTLQSGAEFARWKSGRKRSWFSAVGQRKGADAPPGVRVDRRDGDMEIIFDRPEKHNAFSSAMRDALCEALNLAAIDPTIDRVLLRGEGHSFCSGGDLDEFGSFSDPAMAHAIRTKRSPALALAKLGERVRCEVHGACLGAGVELPSFSREVVAAEDAVFGLPELGLGLIPGAGGTVSLPHRIGRQRTAWLGLSGARIDAQTALDWGLVDEVRLAHHSDPGDGTSGLAD